MHPALFDAYSDNLRKAVSGVLRSPLAGDKYFDLQQKLELNVSRFAAAKAYQVTQAIDRLRADANGVLRPDDEFRALARATLNAFNRYQAAEYNTAVARTRTAKQWVDFNGDAHKNSLLPNIMWLPSRSAVRREEHEAFYHKVWAKTDPFWLQNQPGNLWNCKCDWIETDEPATGAPHDIKPAKGLAGNPGKTGKVFSDDAGYLTPRALKAIEDLRYSDSQKVTVNGVERTLKISVIADHNEVGDNVRTGRVLVENHDIVLEIYKHLFIKGWKNPEYRIGEGDTLVFADAKRLNSWNVKSAFGRAIKQGARVVILDLHNMRSRSLDITTLAKGIGDRVEDFATGRISSCYVVWGNKSAVITSDMFPSGGLQFR